MISRSEITEIASPSHRATTLLQRRSGQVALAFRGRNGGLAHVAPSRAQLNVRPTAVARPRRHSFSMLRRRAGTLASKSAASCFDNGSIRRDHRQIELALTSSVLAPRRAPSRPRSTAAIVCATWCRILDATPLHPDGPALGDVLALVMTRPTDRKTPPVRRGELG